MSQNSIDDVPVLNTGDDPDRPTAMTVNLDIDIEDALESLGPGHRIHFHILFLDGVYVYRGDRSPRFQRLKAPVKDEMSLLLSHVICYRSYPDHIHPLRFSRSNIEG